MTEAPTIEIERVRMARSGWDAFALNCDASYRGLSGWIKLWQMRSHIPFRMVFYNIYLRQEDDRIKIGQCAIGIGIHEKVFADGLQLLPEYQGLWHECLRAVLGEAGPGCYIYGSDWSLEPPQEEKISALTGVKLLSVDRHIVEAVDFSRWKSWDDYQRSISSNVRRNVKTVRNNYKDLEIDTERGIHSLALTRHLLLCKSRMFKRKSVSMTALKMVPKYVLRSLCIPDYAFCSVLRSENRLLAAFGGAEVGRQAYYFDGGSIEADGSGWLLKLSLMQDFYERHPTGRFVMGTSKWNNDDMESWESSARYRRDARVSGFPTSMVKFTYA